MQDPQRSANALYAETNALGAAVDRFKANVRSFYFETLLSRYRCPLCGERFTLVRPSEARCECGARFDPTETYQHSTCCGAKLAKTGSHYRCATCGSPVRSLFLFDENLFDREYFRERMRRSREQRRQRYAFLREMRRFARSSALILTESVNLADLPGLPDDIDDLIGSGQTAVEVVCRDDRVPYERYREHILALLDRAIRFSTIPRLVAEERRDKVHRFSTLIFMEHGRDVNLLQLDNDILVSRP